MTTFLLLCCQNTAQIVKCGCEAAKKTSEQDVAMALTVCCAVVAIVALVVVGFLLWKWMEHIYQKRQAIRQHEWEKEDKETKREAERENRTWQLADEDRKRAWRLADEDRERTRIIEDRKIDEN